MASKSASIKLKTQFAAPSRLAEVRRCLEDYLRALGASPATSPAIVSSVLSELAMRPETTSAQLLERAFDCLQKHPHIQSVLESTRHPYTAPEISPTSMVPQPLNPQLFSSDISAPFATLSARISAAIEAIVHQRQAGN